MSNHIAEIKEKTVPILKKHNAVEAYVFGSTARGDNRPDSDIDILVRFDKMNNLFEFVGIKLDIEDALGGRKVDLVQMEALKKRFRPYVDQDKVRII
jgi:predicted nucleotidyltransferase